MPIPCPIPTGVACSRWLAATTAAILLGSAPSLRAQVVLSEFMAENVSSPFRDEDGSREDWLELHNTDLANPVSLNGWYLRDGGSTWRFPLTSPSVVLSPGGRLRVWCSGKNRKSDASLLHTDFKLAKSGEYLGLLRPDGLTVEHAFAPSYPVQFPDRSYGLSGGIAWQPLVGPAYEATSYTLGIKARVPASSADQAQAWTAIAYDDSAWASRSVGLEGGLYKGIGFDTTGARSYLVHSSGSVQAAPVAMYNVRASIHLRFPFTVSSASQVQALQMRVRYDDGFIVHLNGQKVLEVNAPATPAFNSASTTDREDDQCEDEELFTLAGAQAFLVNGANLLAVQGLNNASGNGLFLFTPVLEARMPATGGPPLGYMAQATPGGENTIAVTSLGPTILEVTRNPPRPPASSNQTFRVEAQVRPTMNPVQSVTLRYVRMFDHAYGSEPSLTMVDDGTQGDLVAGDGAYTALIPGTFMQTLAQSQMLRWRVEATDTLGNFSKNPPYLDASDNERYFGVVAQAPGVSSLLPVLCLLSDTEAVYSSHGHTFQQVSSNSKSGKYVSAYFQRPEETAGRFYDRVKLTLHGQSTSGFGKKSQNVNFSKDNAFQWKASEKSINSFNLLSNYADKAKVRNAMAWQFWNRTGHPSHFGEIVRVQQIIPSTVNSTADTQFYGIWDLVEDGNGNFLERTGLDRNGALYKCYNSLENATQTANNSSGVEKKTREWEGFADLSAFVTALDPANSLNSRRQYAYDNADIPALVNIMAASLFLRSNDFGHKNYYIYRDSNGSGEWSLLPWDQDLSFGHTWVSGPAYFDDDIDSARGLVPGATANNRLMRLISNSSDYGSAPDFARMYLRRLRTLMDTYLGTENAPIPHFENALDAWQNILDPNPGNYASGTDDGDREYRKWGFWLDGSGSSYTYTNASAPDHFLRQHGLRIKSSNPVPPYPGASPYTTYGTDPVHHTTLPAFLPGRRQYLYRTDASRPQLSATLVIPGAQSAQPSLVIESILFNPGNGSQDGEYFIVRNTGSEDVDLSDWKITGQVDHRFRPGTVIPGADTVISGGAGQSVVNQLVVAKKAKAFRTRTVSPKGGEYRQVQGGYQGQLSARGGIVELWRPDDLLNLPTSTYTLVASNTYAGAPTPAQLDLRISELNYNPTDPTVAELTINPNLDDDDFEFVELVNAGPGTLNLAGAQFNKGIGFLFPATAVSTMPPGSRRLVVKNLTAFRIRYGTAHDSIILGEYDGQLDDGGESLQIVDPDGEVVLDFQYDDKWYPPTDSGGRSLVTRAAATSHSLFGKPTAWAISGTVSGSPGAGDAEFARVYTGWLWDHFTVAEVQSNILNQATANPDGDALNNFGEYVFGGNPRLAEALTGIVTPSRQMDGGVEYLVASFRRVRNALDLSFQLECSADMVSWAPFGAFHSASNLGDGTETAVFRGPSSAAPFPCYLRVKVVLAP